MADIATSNVEPQSSPKTAVKKVKKQSDRPKAIHPSTAIMVNNAIQNLKERGGSSLQAIKKYISATYKIDGEKFSPYIKKYIKASVAAGGLVQTKGKGATGSFKLASTAVTKKTSSTSTTSKSVGKPKRTSTTAAGKAKVTKVVKDKKTTVAKKSSTRKTTTTATATLEKKKAVVTAKVAKPKSPSKAKKTTKSPTKKPKSPKPKTTKTKVMKKRASPKKK